ncbi:MAG TPA: LPXTG cell wall anchor domain-containing protein [Marmoricola sp.]|nr:LPXTG cell wall anchor domain-containing protein [Marmoricola sp.]
MAAFALALVGVSATGTAAEAYPQTQPRVHLNHQTVIEGSTLVIHADAVPGCTPWTFTFNGVTRTVNGKHVTVRFKVPKVDRKTTYDLTWSCNQVGAQGGGGTSIAVRTQLFGPYTVAVTVLPRGAQAAAGTPSNGSALPNTGGPNVGLLAAGGVLVLGGAAAMGVGLRRRRVTAA